MLVTRDKTERPRGALLQPDIESGYGLYRIGGSLRSRSASFGGDAGGIPLWPYRGSNSPPSSGGRTVSGGQFDWGGRLLKGNGGAPRFPQRGWKSRPQSAKAEGSLTARPTSRAGSKDGLSDPVVPHGRAIAQRIKATPGITGYPRGSFYPLSDGPSMRNHRITKPVFRPCSTCRSRSQAPLCLYTLRMISNHSEGTFGRLRYLLGGDRPSQTVHLTLSPKPIRLAG